MMKTMNRDGDTNFYLELTFVKLNNNSEKKITYPEANLPLRHNSCLCIEYLRELESIKFVI